MKNLFWPAFRRTLAGLSCVWLVLAGFLTWMAASNYENRAQRLLQFTLQNLNGAYTSQRVNRMMDPDSQLNFSGFLSTAAGALAAEADLCLSIRLYSSLTDKEVARTRTAWGYLDEKEGANGKRAAYELMLDEVLDDAGQLAFARVLAERGTESEHWLTWGYGRYGEVTGVLTTGNKLYPRRMVYYFEEDVPTVLAVAARPLPEGEEVVLTFRSPHLYSQLSGQPRPAALLRDIRAREAALDAFGVTTDPGGTVMPEEPSGRRAVRTCTAAMSGFPYYSGDIPMWTALSFDYSSLATALVRLLPVYLGTLLLLLALAWWMARAQARSLRRERDLTSAVAHELKTPLALLRSYAEGLREDIAPEKREEYLEVIMDESDQMAALVGSLLDLSRLESGRAPFRPEPLALDEVVSAALRPLARPAEGAGVTLTADLAPCAVSGDRERLLQLVTNLCDNALRHTPPGGEVRVRLTAARGKALLRVENDGEPIPAQALPRLFEPFYKVDAARERSKGGAGLGLALVKETAALHGGKCGAEDLPGGVAFWCTLPICPPRAPVV